MLQHENVFIVDENLVNGQRNHATSLIWKSATEIGVGIARTNFIESDCKVFRQDYLVAVNVINPITNRDRFIDNIMPRNIALMDEYFEKLEIARNTPKYFDKSDLNENKNPKNELRLLPMNFALADYLLEG